MDTAKYKKIFLEESRDHLKAMSDGFVLLEKDPRNLDGVDELFRNAHSMKGMASSMGYDSIALLSHAMEDALGMVQKREVKVTREVIDLFLASLDGIDKMVNEVEVNDRITTEVDDQVRELKKLSHLVDKAPAGEPEEDIEEVVPEDLILIEETIRQENKGHSASSKQAEALIAGLDEAHKKMFQELFQAGLHPYYLNAMLDKDAQALGARAFIVLNRLSKNGVIIVSSPDEEEIKRGMIAESFEAIFLSNESAVDLSRIMEGIPEVKSAKVEPVTGAGPSEVDALKGAERTEEPPPEKPVVIAKRSQTVRVDTSILDNLINIVGELFISHERLNTLSERKDEEFLLEEISVLGGLIREFQETIMEVRMMPLDFVAGRFPRMVRDLSRRSGKSVRFEVEGLEIEIDRAILEEVGEVLVHVLRNAVDHGIETMEERTRKGKPQEGLIKFKAYREKDWVFIQISDDGRGIDLDAVRAKVLEIGMATSDVLDKMDHEEIMMLTTAPGFSTAKEVTDISGRGVGLDAVRSKVESIGGAVAIYSVPGEGMTFTVKIPLSLAIVQILVIKVAGQFYGLPISRVHHTTELHPESIKVDGDQEYFKDGRSLVKLERLSALLGFIRPGPQRKTGPVVVVEKGRRKIGFLVDEIIVTRDAVIKSLGQPLMRIPAFTGATIMGDGRPMFILDVLKLL